MHLRTGFHILLASLILTSLISCLGGTDEIETVITTDAQITSFSIAHDSIPVLATAKFSIDQVISEIYNYDSLPYLTDIYEPFIITYTTGAGYSQSLRTIVDGDTAWVASGDSLDLAKVSQFTIFAPDGKTQKTYTLKVNIHQIDPDSVQYEPFATEQFLQAEDNKTVRFKDNYYTFVKEAEILSLYKSGDMEQWEEIPLTGLPSYTVVEEIQTGSKGLFAHTNTGQLYVSTDASSWLEIPETDSIVAILGYLDPTDIQQEGLVLVVNKKDGEGNRFAFYSNLLSETSASKEYTTGGTVPSGFPLTNISVIYNKSLYLNQITVAGDMKTVWATTDGLYWAKLSNTVMELPDITEGSAFLYNNEIWFIGGWAKEKDGTEAYNRIIYYSMDGGVVWKIKEDKTQAPESFVLRERASVVTDFDGKYFYIVGGLNREASTPVLTDVWKVALNSRLFDHYRE
jgi:hypothetical protein